MAQATASLQAATQKILLHLEWLKASKPTHPGAALQHLAGLNEELASAREFVLQVRSQPASATAEVIVLEYCDCLKRLQEVLPIVRSQLLAERTRIKPEQVHVEAAARWLNARTREY